MEKKIIFCSCYFLIACSGFSHRVKNGSFFAIFHLYSVAKLRPCAFKNVKTDQKSACFFPPAEKPEHALSFLSRNRPPPQRWPVDKTALLSSISFHTLLLRSLNRNLHRGLLFFYFFGQGNFQLAVLIACDEIASENSLRQGK